MSYLWKHIIPKSMHQDSEYAWNANVSSFLADKVIGGLNSFVPSPTRVLKKYVQGVVNTIATRIEKVNMDLDSDIVTLSAIKEAYQYLHESSAIVRTPTLKHVQSLFTDADRVLKENAFQESQTAGIPKLPESIELHLKMDNMQTTGSFKIRGCANQMRKMKEENESVDTKKRIVTYSAGNYGKAFAYCVGGMDNTSALVIMPEDVPKSRVSIIKGFGVDVKLVKRPELMTEVEKAVSDGYQLFHSFDDIDLITGHASAGLEVLEEVPDPDIILVCCGGGGFVSGVGAAVSLSGVKNCRVYAVEPEGACTMHESFKQRRAVSLPVKTVATGLSPPQAGAICYKHCRWFVEDVLLVSDEEILTAMRILYCRGIKAEPSGCAAMAALLFNKVPDAMGKKVVVFITGGNVSPSELATHIPDHMPS